MLLFYYRRRWNNRSNEYKIGDARASALSGRQTSWNKNFEFSYRATEIEINILVCVCVYFCLGLSDRARHNIRIAVWECARVSCRGTHFAANRREQEKTREQACCMLFSGRVRYVFVWVVSRRMLINTRSRGLARAFLLLFLRFHLTRSH